MSLQRRYKATPSRKGRFSVFKTRTNKVLPIINDNDNNYDTVDINEIRFDLEPERKINLRSLGNYIRHTKGAQIYTLRSNSNIARGINKKKTKKHKSKKIEQNIESVFKIKLTILIHY